MGDKEDAKKAIRGKKAALRSFLDEVEQIVEAIPIIRRNLEITEWQEHSLDEMNEEAATYIEPALFKHIQEDAAHWENTLPPELPEIDLPSMYTGTATSTFAS